MQKNDKNDALVAAASELRRGLGHQYKGELAVFGIAVISWALTN